MMKEFLDRVVELADKASAVQVIHPAAEPAHIYATVTKGVVEWESADPAPRAHTVQSLEGVVQWAGRSPEETVIWYNRKQIQVILNDASRRDKVTYPLVWTKQLQTLLALENTRTAFAQKEFLFLLRITLSGTLSLHQDLITQIRAVIFRAASESASNIQHGKASLGKKIEHDLRGAELVPEFIVLEVPLFENLILPKIPVRCALEIDSGAERFQLIPLPGQLEDAIREGENLIGQRLTILVTTAELDDSEVALTYGEP